MGKFMGEHLKNAPLVEALLELRWELQQEAEPLPARDSAYPLIVGLLYGQVKNVYPFIEALSQSHLPAELIPFVPTHRFRIGADQWPLVQIGPGIATLNFTTLYRWEGFRATAAEFIEHLASAYESAAALEAPTAMSGRRRPDYARSVRIRRKTTAVTAMLINPRKSDMVAA